MTPEQLKASILQRAMEGKLVPQDPNDEPASELLKRIKAEKEKLIKEGKIKRDKNETEIFRGDDGLHYEKFGDGTVKVVDVPFEIPESWEWVRFKNISSIVRGGSPRPIKEYITEATDGINWIKIGDTEKDGKYINSVKEKIKPNGLNKTRFVQKGTFLLTNSMSFGRPYILNVDGAIHDGWLAISNYEIVFDKDFLYYLLSSKVAFYQFLGLISGAVVKNLNSDKVASIFVPVPPIAEQIRIVDKVKFGISKIDKYAKSYIRLETLNNDFPAKLRKSILQYAMQGKLVSQDPNDEPVAVLLEKIRAEKQKLFKEGKLKKKDLQESVIYKGDDNSYYEKIGEIIEKIDDVHEIPDNWRWVKFGDCLSLISGRDLKTSEFQNNIIGKIPYLTGATNFNAGKINTSRSTDCASVISLKNDLMITVKGTIGEMAFNPFNKAHIARQIMAIRPYLDNVNMEYIRLFLESEIINIQSKAQSMIPGISREVLLSLNIPVPSKNEQDRVIIQVEKFYLQIDQFLLQSYTVPQSGVLE